MEEQEKLWIYVRRDHDVKNIEFCANLTFFEDCLCCYGFFSPFVGPAFGHKWVRTKARFICFIINVVQSNQGSYQPWYKHQDNLDRHIPLQMM